MEEFSRCAVCTRTPLVGEQVTVMRRRGRREAMVCDLCLAKPRAALGDAVRRERVHTAAGAETVSRLIPTPVKVAKTPRRGPGTAAPAAP